MEPQVEEDGWNGERVLRLVERARGRRQQPLADSTLQSYRADVSGHIYFYLDREDEPEPVLLRADQVALDLYWGQPDRVKQVVRGMRSEEEFPIRDFRYYLDRYTVIHNGFDDVIRVGEGRDVRNVVHPLTVQGRWVYQFRLADSTTLRLPGRTDPLRVYEVQVRPRDFDLPAIVGSLFIERARGDLVRLAFTFTPAAYRDPRNERVEVMLENALWEGQYWLPREQRLLVRREIPELDLDVGTVIRGALTVHDYDLNIELPANFFAGRSVVLAGGPETLADYDFQEGLYDGFDDVGLEGVEPGTLDAVDVDAIAGEILRQRFLRGIPRLRFFAPTASHVVRYDRAEGLVLGAGASYGLGRSQLFGYAGWAFGPDRPLAMLGWRPAGPEAGPRWWIEGYLNEPRQIGLRPAADGVSSSLSAALMGEDLRDVFRATGVRGGVEGDLGSRTRWRAGVRYERHRPAGRAVATAPLDEEQPFRPSTPALDDDRFVLEAGLERSYAVGPVSVRLRPGAAVVVPPGLGSVFTDQACLEDIDGSLVDVPCTADLFGRLALHADIGWRAPSRRSGVAARVTAAAITASRPPSQDLLYIGGPNTVPAHPLHGYVGTRAALADVTAWHSVVPRALRLRLRATAGWTGSIARADNGELLLPTPRVPGNQPAEPWSPAPTDGIAASIGAGVGLVDGILRLDYMVRTDSGRGVLLLTVDPRLWPIL